MKEYCGNTIDYKFGSLYCFTTKEECVREAALARRSGFKVQFVLDEDEIDFQYCFKLVDPFIDLEI